jgi:carboxyl-terminal processing protease
MTSRSRWLILLVSTPLVLVAAVGGLLGASAPMGQRGIPHQRVFGDVVHLILRGYVEEVEPDRIMDGAMRGLVDGLDPASAFLTPEEVERMQADVPPAPGDVGLNLTRQYYLRVLGVRAGSPAERAGIRTGDFVRAIDETPTREMSIVNGMRRLRGAVGSSVKLLVIRGNAIEPHELTLTRERVTGDLVTSRRLPGGETLVRVEAFDEGAARAIRAALAQSATSGPGIIIDLRGTAGGPVSEGIAAARLFVKQGVIATLAARDAEPVVTEAAAGDGAIATPVVLLVSNGTAGAAEVFASALLRNRRADLIGEVTAGLAAEQRLVPLPEGHALWLTHARYLHAPDSPIHGEGLTPAVEVAPPVVEFGEAPPAGDTALDEAVAYLRKGRAA